MLLVICGVGLVLPEGRFCLVDGRRCAKSEFNGLVERGLIPFDRHQIMTASRQNLLGLLYLCVEGIGCRDGLGQTRWCEQMTTCLAFIQLTGDAFLS